MFKSNISKTDKALCFVLNKGYLEFSDLASLLNILDIFSEVKGIILVGKIDKVRLKSTKAIVYRQRIFFKSIKTLLSYCKVHGIRIDVPDSFHISIGNLMNCLEELPYIEKYASRLNETIESWLTHSCLIHFHYLLESMDMYSPLERCLEIELDRKIGYLDRAPFLIASYNIDNHTSALFLDLDTGNKKLYSSEVSKDKLCINYGYTDKNVKEDEKGGVFNGR